MKCPADSPIGFSEQGGELLLSGPALVEFIKAVLGKGAQFQLRAGGFSMSPFIRDGDVITISPLSGCSYRIGDIVAFVRPGTGGLCVHRLISTGNNSFLTKGDNAFSDDGCIPAENLLGRVTKVQRDSRSVLLGIGPERKILALLTRTGIGLLLLGIGRRFVRLFCRWNQRE